MGIFPDTLEEAARKLSLKVEWAEEVTWGTLIEGIQSGRYDLHGSAVLRTSSRARAADFTVPLFFEAAGVYVRPGDSRFLGHLERINEPAVRIATIDGEFSDIIARSDFPRAQVIALPQMADPSQLCLEVANGRADVTFLSTRIAAQYIRKNPGKIENIAVQKPIRVTPVCMMVKRDQYEFKTMINAALLETLNNGTVDSLIRKYDPNSDAYYHVAVPYQPPSK
jgi:polar amino acid transport system substrate-binding protein